jgi:hypothetical protein
MIRILLIIIFIFISSAFLAFTPIENQWKLVTEEEGFKVYTRESTVSSIHEIKILYTANSTLDKVSTALDDVPNYKNWVYKCSLSKRVALKNEDDFDYYILTDFPFPLSDRDLVIHTQQTMWPDGKGYSSVSKLLPSEYNKSEDRVRMAYFESKWEVKKINSTTISIDYRVVANPAGDLPAWLVNMAITKGPVETMRKFKALIEG